jgi:superfamily II DNA helicase RecQ
MKIEFVYGGMVFTVEAEGPVSVQARAEKGDEPAVAVAQGPTAASAQGPAAFDEGPGMVYRAEVGLFERLVSLRRVLASEESVPPYVIFQDKALREMAEKRPTDRDAFSAISGVGRVRLEKYGERFLSVIRERSA